MGKFRAYIVNNGNKPNDLAISCILGVSVRGQANYRKERFNSIIEFIATTKTIKQVFALIGDSLNAFNDAAQQTEQPNFKPNDLITSNFDLWARVLRAEALIYRVQTKDEGKAWKQKEGKLLNNTLLFKADKKIDFVDYETTLYLPQCQSYLAELEIRYKTDADYRAKVFKDAKAYCQRHNPNEAKALQALDSVEESGLSLQMAYSVLAILEESAVIKIVGDLYQTNTFLYPGKAHESFREASKFNCLQIKVKQDKKSSLLSTNNHNQEHAQVNVPLFSSQSLNNSPSVPKKNHKPQSTNQLGGLTTSKIIKIVAKNQTPEYLVEFIAKLHERSSSSSTASTSTSSQYSAEDIVPNDINTQSGSGTNSRDSSPISTPCGSVISNNNNVIAKESIVKVELELNKNDKPSHFFELKDNIDHNSYLNDHSGIIAKQNTAISNINNNKKSENEKVEKEILHNQNSFFHTRATTVDSTKKQNNKDQSFNPNNQKGKLARQNNIDVIKLNNFKNKKSTENHRSKCNIL